MKKFTYEEINLINSLNKPIDKIDMDLVNLIIDKMIQYKNYEGLINLLNNLYDFAQIPKDISNRLIIDNNKECISAFLEKEDTLYFLTNKEKNKLKSYLDTYALNIKLEKSYDYYYNLLFKQGVRHWKTIKTNDNTIEHLFTKNNKLIKIKIKEIKEIGLIVSYINYKNYNLTEKEQILKGIDYINDYGFNINRNIKNDAIINK